MYLTHNVGSASALPLIQREIDGSDVTIVALKLAMNLHFPLPKLRTIREKDRERMLEKHSKPNGIKYFAYL